MKKVLRIIIMSILTCFSLTFVLILINAFMSVFVGLNYYFAMACILTVCMSIGLILFDLKKIVTKRKASRKVNTNIRLRTRQKVSHAKRKIS